MPVRPATPCRDRLCRNTTRERHGYCEDHADQAKAWSRGRAGQGRGGRPWRRIRKRIFERDRYLCQECRRQGCVTPATTVDHIVCKAEGGTDSDDNLEALCGPCHEAKTLEEAKRARQRGA